MAMKLPTYNCIQKLKLKGGESQLKENTYALNEEA